MAGGQRSDSDATVDVVEAYRQPTKTMLGFPIAAWAIIGVEFFERLAYYGAAFTLSTYCTNMLALSESTTNSVVNVLYIVSPISACFASGFADGSFGRPKTLLLYLCIYTIGLAVIAVSSLPFMFDNFPYGASDASLWLCILGVALFGVGYGGFKVCTSPITADEVSLVLDETFRRSLPESLVAAESSSPEYQKAFADFKEAQLSFLFRLIYWSINFGSLFGIIGAPALRTVDSRTVVSGSSTAHTGYYAGYLMCAASTVSGTLVYLIFHRFLHRNQPTESFLLFRVVGCALRNRWWFAVGSVRDDDFTRAHSGELLVFAAWPATPNSDNCAATDSPFGLPDASPLPFDAAVVSNVKQTLTFCKSFVTLPLYWLISNQFSTNVVLTANNMDIPDGVPPEALNNVNTITLLLTVIVVDKWLFPWWFGVNRRPCVQSRITVGFLMVAVAMAWCGVLQLLIDHRGTYDAAGDYHLLPRQSYLSVLWLLGPYVLQGIASVFVDTTVLEAAYVMAPPNMKSTVMALYLLASSASGFLGLAFTPLADQSVIGIMYFVLALLQGLVTLLFLKSGVARPPIVPPGEALPLLQGRDTTA
jgi:dipeptide/tripeptide permease